MQHAAHFAHIAVYASGVNDYNYTDAWMGMAKVHVQLHVACISSCSF